MMAEMNRPPPTRGLPQKRAAFAMPGFATTAATSHDGRPRIRSGAITWVSSRCCTMCMLKR
jgi:hypothetical protein